MSEAVKKIGLPDLGEENELLENRAKLAAIDNSMAIIEFTTEGEILSANENLLRTMGYELDEIAGRHHRIFCDESYARSPEYKKFWKTLGRGEHVSGQFKRINKAKEDVWIEGSYTPVFNKDNDVVKVIKFATDITAAKNKSEEDDAKLAAIDKVQARIEFMPDGTITFANENFLSALGYELREIEGQHHRLFCEKNYINSFDYQKFWKDLAAGQFQVGEYKRIKKDGSSIWISASYNPIVDREGQVKKIVKYATDITKMKELSQMAQMVDKSPIAVMFATPDGSLTYMNNKSRTVLKTIEKNLPDRVENLVGQSIDIFHKNPQHQKNIISDPKNLPHQANIKVGDDTLDLLVSAVLDADGTYLGAMVNWEKITQKVELVENLERASESLASASQQLNATAMQMTSNSEETTAQSSSAASAAEEVSKGVETVTTNTEEMNASIKEISHSVNEASIKSNEAKKQAEETNKTIEQLGSSSQEIGKVIKVISSIAQQTNLLALNATIEAARAGEAGRGFAVVANEVKELAKQTAGATEEITSKINAIQKDSDGAVGAIGSISLSIDNLNKISGTIAAAVEEQMATTGEVARVVKESNQGVQGIAENIKQVSLAAQNTSQGATQLVEASRGLAELADKIRGLVKEINV